MKVPKNLIPILDEMYYELSTEQLEVCLVPEYQHDDDMSGRMIRAVTGQNPDWYKELCARYPSTRKRRKRDDTKIKRAYTLVLLERMMRRGKSMSMYVEDLLEVAREREELYQTYQKSALECLCVTEEAIPWDNQF